MVFDCQKVSLEELNRLSQVNRQSLLIEGPSGCGKSYLSQQYANMLGIDDFVSVEPKVNEIREALDSSLQVDNRVLLCIENLDQGVASAAYTLLKSLEEPQPNVYIVITCRNIKMIPDTIISRSAVITANSPLPKDIDAYGHMKDTLKYNNIKDRLVWRCVKSFSEADAVLQMSNDQIAYYESLSEVCKFNDNVSNIVWAISHYADNQSCNLELSIRSIMELMHNSFITQCGIDCLRDLSSNRIAQHAVLSKFVFNAKYCE